jgi:hypothetical protein
MTSKPQKPNGLDAPGLKWRAQNNRWVAYWKVRTDIATRGYQTRMVRLWAGVEPSADEWKTIASTCMIQQVRMLAWAANGDSEVATSPNFDPRSLYDGTLGSLIDVYQRDPDSPYQVLRWHTRKRYDLVLAPLKAAVGEARIPALNFRDFKRWYEGFSQSKTKGGPRRRARGHSFMTFARIVLSFGALLNLAGCEKARETLAKMEFAGIRRRTQVMTPAYIEAFVAKAIEMGWPSIALAQLLQDTLICRQKDIIGEWIPVSEPGLSDIVAGLQKWIVGLRLEEITGTILTHRLSKSLKGRGALAEAEAGIAKSWDLSVRPHVLQLLRPILAERSSGPIIVCEYTGLPWRSKVFAAKWRKIATAAGIPKTVQNRDTRAGGITDGRKAGVPLEDLRHGVAHSQLSTTAGYDRDDIETDRKIVQLRSKRRNDDAKAH